MNEDNGYVYTYSIEELDEIIGKMNKGIRVIMTPELEEDLKLRLVQLQEEMLDEDDVEEFKEQHSELLKKKLEQKKRQATKKDVIVIQLSDEQKKQLEEDMSVSIVRRNPELGYHKRDEELFDSKERREIYQKLSSVQKCYYNQADYVNAVNIIMDAVRYSLAHDYPWMSMEEAIDEFNKGHIRFEYCQLPKLYINWTTTIDDPMTLKGIINGTITMINSDDDNKKKKKVVHPKEGAMYDVDVTGVNEWNQLYAMHQKGYDTPISPIIKASTGTFSRFSLPDTNWFYTRKEQQQREPLEFDWMQEGAGSSYFDMVHGITYTTADLMDDIAEANNNNLRQSFQGEIDSFLSDLKRPAGQTGNELYQSSLVQTRDQKTIAMEQSILEQMRKSNPNH